MFVKLIGCEDIPTHLHSLTTVIREAQLEENLVDVESEIKAKIECVISITTFASSLAALEVASSFNSGGLKGLMFRGFSGDKLHPDLLGVPRFAISGVASMVGDAVASKPRPTVAGITRSSGAMTSET